MSNSVSIVTALHGNELQPFFAAKDLGLNPLLGNPRAAAKNLRFLDKDLNASFGSKGNAYEEIRAREILEQLPVEELVLDFHTFSCESEPFCIIVEMALLDFAKKLGVSKIVLMTHNIKAGGALINHRPGVSIEAGQHQEETSFQLTQEILQNLSSGRNQSSVELFEVCGTISEPGTYQNFVETSQGFFPVLAGEKAYSHPGLMAKSLKL
jgi:hypothetical protein